MKKINPIRKNNYENVEEELQKQLGVRLNHQGFGS